MPPAVLSTFPDDGSTGVPLDSIVTVSFSKALSRSSVNEKTFTVKKILTDLVSDQVDIAGKIRLASDDKTVIFIPNEKHSPNTKHIAKIEGVKDKEERTFAAIKSWSFTTKSE